MSRRTSDDRATAAPSSFASVARKVSGWTTNLIASGMILVLALGLGRQLIGWWHVEPEQVAPGAAADALDAGNANPWAPCTLEFGDAPYSIEQQLAHGDRAEAVRQLLAACRRATAQCAMPTEPASEAEEQLLGTVQLLEPLEASQGVRFYGPDAGFPLVVAVADAQLGASRDRVLVWGIAAPAGEQDWSLYTFRLGERSTDSTADVPSVPLPLGSQRTMSLRDAQGLTLVAFAGNGTADDWRQSLGGWFSRKQWSVVERWHLAGDVWHARFARGNPPGRATVEVQFGPEPSGRLAGLLRIVPAVTAPRVISSAEAPAAGATQREQR